VVSELDIVTHPQITSPATYESAFTAESQAALEKIRDLIPELSNMPHETYICRGRVWNAISEIISQQHIDLLVAGTHGRTGVGKLLMGSIAEEISRQAPCPVLTVGPRARGRVREEFDETGKNIRPADIELKRIIFATDFTTPSLAAAPLAISLAEEFEAGLVLMHVIDVHHPIPGALVLRRLEGLVPQEAKLWCTPESMIRYGDPAEEILRVVSERNADLVVLGVRAVKVHLGPVTHFPWSTAHRVIADSICPVLTVRE
jgi:nucleotide-binding universal stress UspA family protein